MPACFTRSLSQDPQHWRVLTTTSDVGQVTQGQGVPGHRVLHTRGAQHFQAWHCGPLAGPPVSVREGLNPSNLGNLPRAALRYPKACLVAQVCPVQGRVHHEGSASRRGGTKAGKLSGAE